jgi:hypothetical protein
MPGPRLAAQSEESLNRKGWADRTTGIADSNGLLTKRGRIRPVEMVCAPGFWAFGPVLGTLSFVILNRTR